MLRFALALLFVSCAPASTPGPEVTVSGRAFTFGPSGDLTLTGAKLYALGFEDAGTTLPEAPYDFTLQALSKRSHAFVIEQEGFMPTQTATLEVDETGLDLVGFQVPTLDLAALLGQFIPAELDATRCQIATTISRLGTEPYGGSGLGLEGVTVELSPALPRDGKAHGPVYFRYVNDNFIYPDPELTASTIDGGVLYVNVPPGRYTLTAKKAGHRFTSVTLDCRAGVLVNAAPPRGLQEE